MRKILPLAVLAATTAFAAPAFAEQNFSLGYAAADLDPFDVGAVVGRYGWNNGTFGVEGEAMVGVSDDTVGGVTAELNYGVGVFGVVQGEIGEGLVVFGRVGYADAEVKGTVGGVSADVSDNGIAYGAGASWYFDGVNGVRADYTKYDFDADADVWSLAYTRRF